MTSVLMVCVGNICRSPMAERLLHHRATEAGLSINVSSAGVDAVVGSSMDPHAAQALVRLGGSPTGFTAQQVTTPLIVEADLVLTATKAVRARVLGVDPSAMRRTFTVAEFAALAREPGLAAQIADDTLTVPERVALAARARSRVAQGELDVPDPYGQSETVHAAVADHISAAIDDLLPLLG